MASYILDNPARVSRTKVVRASQLGLHACGVEVLFCGLLQSLKQGEKSNVLYELARSDIGQSRRTAVDPCSYWQTNRRPSFSYELSGKEVDTRSASCTQLRLHAFLHIGRVTNCSTLARHRYCSHPHTAVV